MEKKNEKRNGEMTASIALIVQARTGSTRLPSKVLLPILDKSMLARQIERLKRVKNKSNLLVATTEKKQDDAVISLCKEEGVLSFRGSEENVLERYYLAAKKVKADIVVRITADCPLIDPAVIDQVIVNFLEKTPNVDYASNTLNRTYPRGMDCEVFSFNVLEKVYFKASSQEEKEHVTPYIYTHQDLFKCLCVEQEENNADLQLSVDTKEDYERVKKVYEALYHKNPQFTLKDIVKYLRKNE